ncbi:MAG: SusC/RagA family TonB-linked outer membrane protein [Saprospiraceae bacterium]|nr:SusC/RagA family TonB-linked outer membrane protein [Saprospiraceae bacterium]
MKRFLFKSVFSLLLFAGFTVSVAAQKTVSGTVTDASNSEPLIGANVLIKGAGTGTITDIDGTYSLKVEEGSVLIFSYAGYTDQEITIGASSTINVSLSAGKLLDEVVVVGYGSVKRSDLTGSVASISAKDFNGGLVTSTDQLIQGKAAGVQILNNSGQPGGQTTIRIRGNSSIRAGNNPLFVVDGIPFSGASTKAGTDAGDLGAIPGSNPLNFINPADIESMQILKDASAAAIYGSRGANGVVLITTKRGKSGDPQIDFNASVGVSNIVKRYDVLDGDGYRQALQDYGLTTGNYGSSVNAMDEILRSGITQNHNLSISAGNQNGSYRLGFGYLNQEGIIKNSDMNRLNASLNGNYKFLKSKRLSVDVSLIASRTRENGVPVSTNAGFTGNLVAAALQWNPTSKMYNADGTPVIIPEFGNTSLNPVAILDAYNDRSQTLDIFANISPSYKINDHFTYKFSYGMNSGVGSRNSYIASFLNLQNVEGRGLAAVQEKRLTTQVLTHTLTYDNKLTDDLNLNFVAGYEYQKFDERGSGIVARDFIVEDFDYTTILQNTIPGSRNIFGYASPITELQSYFGRATFNLLDKYLLTATVRADGSSKFGSNNRTAVFPALAFAWNLHNEDFLKDGAFNSLKLRLGWGKTGNSEFPAGAALDRFRFTEQSIVQDNVGNPDLQWEATSTINAGIDFAIMDYKISGSVDYFNRNTSNLLFNFPTIQPAPAGRYWVNLPGNVINSGVELTLNADMISRENFRWNLGANVTFLSNVLENYSGPNLIYGQLFGQGISGATIHRFENGQPLHSFYLRNHVGIGDDGLSIYEDNEKLSFLGNPNPTTLLGISTTVETGKLSLNLNFNGALGQDVYNNTQNTVLPITNLGTRNVDANLLGQPVQESTANAIKSSNRYLEDGSYLKLANATLSYGLGNIGSNLRNARVYLTGQNLLVFTKYSGFDPEVNTVNDFNGIPSFGIEYIPYPSARTIILGFNFSL